MVYQCFRGLQKREKERRKKRKWLVCDGWKYKSMEQAIYKSYNTTNYLYFGWCNTRRGRPSGWNAMHSILVDLVRSHKNGCMGPRVRSMRLGWQNEIKDTFDKIRSPQTATNLNKKWIAPLESPFKGLLENANCQ